MKDSEGLIKLLGIEGHYNTFETHSNLIMLYLYDHLLQELANIAQESTKSNDPNVSYFATNEEALEAYQQSATKLGDRLAKFKPEDNLSIVQSGLYGLVSLFGGVVAKQGSGNSLLDFTTPAIQELAPIWHQWITS